MRAACIAVDTPRTDRRTSLKRSARCRSCRPSGRPRGTWPFCLGRSARGFEGRGGSFAPSVCSGAGFVGFVSFGCLLDEGFAAFANAFVPSSLVGSVVAAAAAWLNVAGLGVGQGGLE